MGAYEPQEMPHWLESLLGEKFFSPCSTHESSKKNEKNILCLDCCSSFCSHCLPSHRPHRLLQIRRYVYHDVVRVEDLERLINLSAVQSYTTNSAKVVFLNERVQNRPFRGGAGVPCRHCDRPLQDPYLYCSLSCKVKVLLGKEGGLSRHLRECELISLEGQLTPDSILEPTSSGSTTSGAGGPGAMISTAGSRLSDRRKPTDSAGRTPNRMSGGISGRRKPIPTRAPLF